MAKNCLLISDGFIHPSVLARRELYAALDKMPAFTFRHAKSLEKIVEMNLDDVNAIVLYFHHDQLSAEALTKLESFVADGGGLLALHSASASFKQNDAYFKLLGGRFITHGRIHKFGVLFFDDADALFGKRTNFTVTDELYRHRVEPDVKIHLVTQVEDEDEPVIWTRLHKKGCVAYLALGHRSGVWRQPAVRDILQTSLDWLCAGRQTR